MIEGFLSRWHRSVVVRVARQEFVQRNRDVERKVQDLDGWKWLYAHTFYTASEFWSIYDAQAYAALRTKYKASGLPTIYDKVKLDLEAEEKVKKASRAKAVWPIRGLYGIWHAVVHRDYLLSPEKERKATGGSSQTQNMVT